MFKQVLYCGIVILSIVALFFYLCQRKLIYFPAKEQPDRYLFHAQDMQEVKLSTDDGLTLNAWYKPAVETHPTLLYFHGNAGHIGYRMPLVRQFLSAGYGVLLFDYRGYGGNPGEPTEEGLYRDGRAAMKFLEQQGLKPEGIALYGESLGTAVAIKMAEIFPVCAVVLQSPFTSLSAMARYLYPWAIIPPWDKFDSLSRIKEIKAPLLILHGKNDQVVPFDQGLMLFNQANQPKRMVAIDNKGHGDLWEHHFYNSIIDFIQTHCP